MPDKSVDSIIALMNHKNPGCKASEEAIRLESTGVLTNKCLDTQSGKTNEYKNSQKPKKPNSKGRAGRRREAKLRVIHKLTQSTEPLTLNELQKVIGESNNEDDVPTCSTIDREISLPGVLEVRQRLGTCTRDCNDSIATSERVFEYRWSSIDDEIVLKRQLGYIPGNSVRIAARGFVNSSRIKTEDTYLIRLNREHVPPLVLQLYPLAARHTYPGDKSDGRKFKSRKRGKGCVNLHESDLVKSTDAVNDPAERDAPSRNGCLVVEPFPTIYWLTCPVLKAFVSTLEQGDKYTVRHMEDRLKRLPDALSCMKEAHMSYGIERWSLLTNSDRQSICDRGWEASLNENRGIAGITRPETVKCLHTHLAHYLAGETQNCIGEWTLEALKQEYNLSIESYCSVKT